MSVLPTIPFSLALAGLDSGDLRADLRRTAEAGYRFVQLNVAAPTSRPRDFDRSARRDLAATIRRFELRLSGVDLWIPSKHFTDPAHVDRAVQSVLDAIEFAGELAPLTEGHAVLSVSLPAHDAIAGELATMTAAAERCACRIADHHWPPDAGRANDVWVGVDPATMMIADPAADVAAAVSVHANRVASLRLSDLDESSRVPAGDGRLDLLMYLVTASTCAHAGPVVVDVRGLQHGWDLAPRLRERAAGRMRLG